MGQNALLYPVFAMALLSAVVALILLQRRVRAVREGLAPGYFRLNRGAKLPASLLVAEQHYQNIFEMPLLFYVAMLVAFSAVPVTLPLLLLAWGYVAARAMHSLVHLGHNNLLWRRNLFVASFLLLLLLWGWLLLQLLSAGR